MEITQDAKSFLADKGFDPAYGARPLKRAIQNYLEDQLAELLLSNTSDKQHMQTISVNTNSDKTALEMNIIDIQ